MKTYVTVNRGVIDSNTKHGKNDPPIRAVRGKDLHHADAIKPKMGHVIRLNTIPPVYFVQDQNNPLPWGARVWVETAATFTTLRRVPGRKVARKKATRSRAKFNGPFVTPLFAGLPAGCR